MAQLADLADPGTQGFLVGDGEWPFRGFVVRQGDAVYAYANICPHLRHPLDFPPDRFLTPNGDMLRCSSHGALFTPATGDCVFGPCLGRSLMALELRVVEDEIWVKAPSSLREIGSFSGDESGQT